MQTLGDGNPTASYFRLECGCAQLNNQARFSVNLTGSFWFGDALLFGDIGLQLGEAEWTCLVGASGVGKSTLLRLIAGLETGGRFNGEITASDGLPLNARVAYMAQSDLLMPWLTVTQNIALGSSLRQQSASLARIEQLINDVGLSEHAHKKPAELSGGMRQRTALARTLLEDTPLVLLDEPFSALDVPTRSRIQELAFDKLRGRTVLLVTHDPAEAVRMGHRLFEVASQTLIAHAVPQTPPVRAVDQHAVLHAQAGLLRALSA